MQAKNQSFISAIANAGNSGSITVNANKYIYLENSGTTTTTYGATSNGGNINITAPVLALNTGVIQANAIGGFGGDINLNLQALIASYNNLILGGDWVYWQPFIPGLNVIQAASATGVSDTLLTPLHNSTSAAASAA